MLQYLGCTYYKAGWQNEVPHGGFTEWGWASEPLNGETISAYPQMVGDKFQLKNTNEEFFTITGIDKRKTLPEYNSIV